MKQKRMPVVFYLSVVYVLALVCMVEADNSQCTLYMAPTSTVEDEEFARLGMYAGIDIEPGRIFGSEIAIPVIDVDLHNGVPRGQRRRDFFAEQGNFMWDSRTIHAKYEIYPEGSPSAREGMMLLVAMPGIGSLTNQHSSYFSNAKFNDDSMMNRIPSATSNGKIFPSYGANTQYHNITMKSSHFIPAGMEILVDNLGREDEEEEVDEVKLEAADYAEADDTMRKILDFFENKFDDSVSNEEKSKIYNYLINDVLQIAGTDGARLPEVDKKHIMDTITALLPKDHSEIKLFLNSGGTFQRDFPDTLKSKWWLEQNGQCLDGLYPGPSSIEGAEKGAYATRDIKEGDLISPAPLLMIQNKEYLDMYSVIFKRQGKDKLIAKDYSKKDPISKQLLVNYCFGHPGSSLLFYPYGMTMNLINHKPTGEGANAKLVWSSAAYHNNAFFEDSAEDLKMDPEAILGLGMDIIATRDISADEEVFLDYGPEWQQAFDEYTQNWDEHKSWPKQAVEMNSLDGPFLTDKERHNRISNGENDPIPENIMIACFILSSEKEEEPVTVLNGTTVFDFDEKSTHDGDNLKICEVIEREIVERNDDIMSYIYDVRVREGFREERIVRKVPHDFIMYFDSPYKSLLHALGTFRHPIMIPSDIFPEAWLDL